jgi:hypothetical protein
MLGLACDNGLLFPVVWAACTQTSGFGRYENSSERETIHYHDSSKSPPSILSCNSLIDRAAGADRM